nr:hypothetical protein GCM10020093_053840 [Planobispora longispora]
MPSFRSGRRYRFGRPAAFVAIGYMLTVLVAAVIALTDDDRFLWRLLFSDYRSGPREDPTGWSVLLPVLAGGAQGWALWQILRGRVAGDRARPRGAVRWLRWALYANLVLHLLFYRFLDYPDAWWVNVCWSLLELALVLLFHRVLTGVSRPLRFTVLAAGTFVMIASIGAQVTGALGLDAAGEMFGHALLDGTSWTLWTVLLIVAQARDGRWGRTTVWAGVASLAMPLLIPSLLLGFHSPGEDSYPALVISIWAVSHIFTPVWLARSAHDLAGPDVGAVPGRRRRPRSGRRSAGGRCRSSQPCCRCCPRSSASTAVFPSGSARGESSASISRSRRLSSGSTPTSSSGSAVSPSWPWSWWYGGRGAWRG